MKYPFPQAQHIANLFPRGVIDATFPGLHPALQTHGT
ncbi:hypothetical protein SAMN04488121_101437, partial [Chitinophaga filiformis]